MSRDELPSGGTGLQETTKTEDIDTSGVYETLQTAGTVEFVEGPNAEEVIDFEVGEYIVGRSEDADAHLEDSGVSKRHCRFYRRDSSMYVDDLDSSNGTVVNGEVIEEPYELEEGDVISIGEETRLRYTEFEESFSTSYSSNWFTFVLRFALGLVYVWFGALKVIGLSPVETLVAKAVPFVPGWFSVPFIGLWEVVVGLGLITGVSLGWMLVLFWLHIPGTFIVLVFQPDVAYQYGNPLLLTDMGEFVVKNVIIVAAGLAITIDFVQQQKEHTDAESVKVIRSWLSSSQSA